MGAEKKLRRAVEAAVVAHRQDVWRFALSLSRQRDMADDLTQATCLRAIEKAHTLSHDTHLRAWLLRLCRSIWLNERRSSALRQTEPLEDAGAALRDLSNLDVEMNIFTSQVLSHVMALPTGQREVVALVYGLGHRYREAAEILDVPIGTVMSRLAAARRQLAPLKEDLDG